MVDIKTRQEAAKEMLKRRKARASLLEFVKYTAPWFISSWHHTLICAALERMSGITNTSTQVTINGKTVKVPLPDVIKRLMVFAPPRHSKSELTSIRRPAWLLGSDPTQMFMSICYGSDLAVTFSKACTGTMQSQSYQTLFPVKFDRLAKERWKIARPPDVDNQRDSFIASGILSPLTGEGATAVSLDDPYKNKSEAYSKTIRDRVADEYQTSIRTRLQRGATIALLLTRWHQDDLAGRLIAKAKSNKKADQWIVLVLAATNDDGEQSYIHNTADGSVFYLPRYDALWPEFLTRDELDTTKASMSSAFWEAMYQQAPTTPSGSIFKPDKWQEYHNPIALERLVHVWDTAMTGEEESDKADYSAHVSLAIADGRFLVRDAYRERLTFPDLVRQVYAKWDASCSIGDVPERLLIEQKGSGISLLQTIEANNQDPWFEGSRIPVLGMPATLSKEVRALSISGYQEAGMCALPAPEQSINPDGSITVKAATFTKMDGTEVEWVADFIEELAAFPKGANDDWCDGFVHGCTFYTRPHPEEEHSEVVVYDEDVTVSSELDRIDRGW